MGAILEMVRIDPDVIQNSPLPPSARLALTSVGLPRVVGEEMGPLFSTSLESRRPIPNLNEIRGRGRDDDNSPYWWIGTDYGTDICIDHRTGHVLSIDSEGATRFVNTDVQRLVLSLQTLHANYLQKPGDQTGRRPDPESMIARLREIDEAALADDAWWALIAEQLREGLF